MAPERAMLDDVLVQVEKLSLADKARLVAHIASSIASALASQESHEAHAESLPIDDRISQLPADSPAGQLVRDPSSALGKLVRLVPGARPAPSDEQLARWRAERLTERYGA